MPMRYGPIGRCIYCLSDVYSEQEPHRKLGTEHIIAEGIGGELLLPEASCKRCEKITSGIETKCINALFNSGRPHLPFTHGKSQLSRRTQASAKIGRQGKNIKLPLDKHPGSIMMFNFDVAEEISGLIRNKSKFDGQIKFAGVTSDFQIRVRKLGGLQIRLGGGITAEPFGRMLAKIAHAYTVAEIGLSSFEPCLRPCIIGSPPFDNILKRFVGSALLEEPRGKQNHEIELLKRTGYYGQELFVVRIRLFAKFGMPSHYVVSGNPTVRERQ
jgi:hypothetical protein